MTYGLPNVVIWSVAVFCLSSCAANKPIANLVCVQSSSLSILSSSESSRELVVYDSKFEVRENSVTIAKFTNKEIKAVLARRISNDDYELIIEPRDSDNPILVGLAREDCLKIIETENSKFTPKRF